MMDMKDGVVYTTEITAKKYRADELIETKTYHNTGTWNLFNVICRALTGDNLSTLAPRYLDLRTSDGSYKAGESILITPSILKSVEISGASGDVTSETDGCSLSLTFSLYGDDIRTATGSNTLYYVLANSYITTSEYSRGVLALIDTGYTVESFGLATDEMLLLEWKMTFENK